MPDLTPNEIENGTKMLVRHLEGIVESDSEIADLHEAFELYCATKFGLGTSATTQRTGSRGKKDLGIDFFSSKDANYVVGQCKIPDDDWMEANPGKIEKVRTQCS